MDIPNIRPRQTGKPAIDRHHPCGQSAFPLARWCDQVKVKVILGKVFPVGPSRRFGHQLPSRLGEGLAGATITVGRIAHGFRHHRADTRFALLHQFQCPQIVRSVARQHVHGDDQLAVGVHHDGRLAPVKPPPATPATTEHHISKLSIYPCQPDDTPPNRHLPNHAAQSAPATPAQNKFYNTPNHERKAKWAIPTTGH